MGVEMMPFDFLDIGDVIKRYPEITKTQNMNNQLKNWAT